MKPEAQFIKFLGTAGARHVVSRQLRASGGIWLQSGGTQVLIDPGPGCLVRCMQSRPRLHPEELQGIILTHRHLDHSCDVNIMIEAMTDGGTRRRGALFVPADALTDEPVVFSYARGFVSELTVLQEGGRYRVGDLTFETPVRHRHAVETYGLKFRLPEITLSIIADTGFFPELAEAYRADVLVINTLSPEPGGVAAGIHLNTEDAAFLIREIKPRLAVLTHFGMRLLNSGPARIAQGLTERLGIQVIAAEDGMTVRLDKLGQKNEPESEQKSMRGWSSG